MAVTAFGDGSDEGPDDVGNGVGADVETVDAPVSECPPYLQHLGPRLGRGVRVTGALTMAIMF